MKATNKINILLIKHKAMDLLRTNQLPFRLVYYIQGLDIHTDIKIVTYLMECTEKYLRVKGYYKKYKLVENEYNRQIEEGLKNL